MKAKRSSASACDCGMGGSFFMGTGLARRTLPQKKTLLWDQTLGCARRRPPETNRSVPAATGPVANRRNRLKASACSAGPETATSPPPNPRCAATLSRVAGRYGDRSVVSGQRRLGGLELWSESGSRLGASNRPRPPQAEDRAHSSPPLGCRRILGGARLPAVDKSTGSPAARRRCGRNGGTKSAALGNVPFQGVCRSAKRNRDTGAARNNLAGSQGDRL